MKKPTPVAAKAAPKTPAAKKPAVRKAKPATPAAEPKPPAHVDERREDEALKPAAELVADEGAAESEFERQVGEDENDTMVGDPADARDGHHEHARVPTDAERQALLDHIELRVTELVTYVRAEAAKFGADPSELAGYIAEQVRQAL